MKKSHLQWDNLSDHFSVYGESPRKSVIANVTQIEEALNSFLSNVPRNSSVLDFGCGTGFLSNRLHTSGYLVSGIDVSQKMIEVATRHSPPSVRYSVGGAEQISKSGKFDAIISLMVCQFVKDIKSLFSEISAGLKNNGRLLISVHNIDYILRSDNNHTRFLDIDSTSDPKQAKIVLETEEIPIYIRTADEYIKACKSSGLKHDWSWESVQYYDGTPAKYQVMAFDKM